MKKKDVKISSSAAMAGSFWLELILFVLLLSFAAIFFKERLYTDSSYYIFQVLNNESFHIELQRYILLIPELFPLLAIKLGMSLKTILVFFSLGQVLFFMLLFVLLKLRYQWENAGVLLLGILILGIRHAAFVPIFELYYALGFVVLLSAALRNSRSWVDEVLKLISIFFVLFSHPMALPVVLFIYFLVVPMKKESLNDWLLLLGLVCISFTVKYFFIEDYESVKMDVVFERIKSGEFISIFSWNYITGVLNLMVHTLWDLGLIVLTAFLVFVWRVLKGKDLLLFVIWGLVGAAVQISLMGFEHSRYLEQTYMLFGFISLYYLLLQLEKKTSDLRVIARFALNILLYAAFLSILFASKDFSERSHYIESLINECRENGESRIVVNETSFPQNSVHANWSVPLESLLISSCSGESVSIALNTDVSFAEKSQVIEQDDVLIRRWDLYSIDELNNSFFKFTEGSYKQLDQVKQKSPVSLKKQGF